jgi:hypothetical protein
MSVSFKSVLAGAAFGITLTTVVFTLNAHSNDRIETFGLLARDLRVAKDVAKISSPARIAASRSVAHDLQIVFMRYESLRQDETRLLQLTREWADAGIVVLPKDILTELRAKVKMR